MKLYELYLQFIGYLFDNLIWSPGNVNFPRIGSKIVTMLTMVILPHINTWCSNWGQAIKSADTIVQMFKTRGNFKLGSIWCILS